MHMSVSFYRRATLLDSPERVGDLPVTLVVLGFPKNYTDTLGRMGHGGDTPN